MNNLLGIIIFIASCLLYLAPFYYLVMLLRFDITKEEKEFIERRALLKFGIRELGKNRWSMHQPEMFMMYDTRLKSLG